MSDLIHDGGNQSMALARFVDIMSAKEFAELQRLLSTRSRTS